MNDDEKWKRNAERLLAQPVVHNRDLGTVIGKVEALFSSVMKARQAGMSWTDISTAIAKDGPAKPESVESAFRRLCSDRGIAMPRHRTKRVSGAVAADDRSESIDAASAITYRRRVDNGDD